MITTDQPTIFDSNIVSVGLSSVDDGDMRFIEDSSHPNYHHRLNFLDELSIETTQVARLQPTFDGVTDFTRYQIVDDSHEGEGMLDDTPPVPADGLVVTRPDQDIFLLLADCVGAVIYDAKARVLMVSHLGRQSVEVDGGRKSIQYLQDQFDCQPADLRVWLSPAVGSDSYPLEALEGRGLQQVVISQLTAAGVAPHQIEVSAVDTAKSNDYFSHSEFLAGTRDSDGRFAIVAMMRGDVG